MNTVRPLPLDEYRDRVGHHLDMIEAGANMTARHVRTLDRRPSFDTRARGELDSLEATLERALAKVRDAKAGYDSKPVESPNAA